MKDEANYNGWTNQATWSVIANLTNDSHLYALAKSLSLSDPSQFENFCRYVWQAQTPDGYDLSEVDWGEIAASWGE